jgi:hypothetical protein
MSIAPSDELLKIFAQPITGDRMAEYFANFGNHNRRKTSMLSNEITTIVVKCATDANIYGCYATNPELKGMLTRLLIRIEGADTSLCNKDILALCNECCDKDLFLADVCNIVDGYLDEFKKHPKENGFCDNLLKSIPSLKDNEYLKENLVL